MKFFVASLLLLFLPSHRASFLSLSENQPTAQFDTSTVRDQEKTITKKRVYFFSGSSNRRLRKGIKYTEEKERKFLAIFFGTFKKAPPTAK